MKMGMILAVALVMGLPMVTQAQKITYTCVDTKDGHIGLRMWIWGQDGYPTEESRYIAKFPKEIEPGSGSRDGLTECRNIARYLNQNSPK